MSRTSPAISDAQTILGLLEDGQLMKDLTEAFQDVVRDLNDQSKDSPSRTFKGHVQVKIGLAVKDGFVEISSDLTTKTPARARKASSFWALDGGRLSTSHPKQLEMFGGPREVPNLNPAAPTETNPATA